MPEQPRDRWRGRSLGPPGGRRPRWWPEGEEWPPSEAAGWQRMRRRFMWRFGAFVVVVIVALAIVISFLVDVVSSLFGGHPSIAISALLAILILAIVAGGMRRIVRATAAP